MQTFKKYTKEILTQVANTFGIPSAELTKPYKVSGTESGRKRFQKNLHEIIDPVK
jgi:hypothetical protein